MSTIYRPSVLYVDHDKDSCEMMTSLLGFYEIAVRCAESVTEAITLAQTCPPDLYLIASRFDDGTGIELCGMLRALRPTTPIVFYSGDAYETYIKAALLAGADAFVAKPDCDVVVTTIAELTKHKRARRSGGEVRRQTTATARF
jgi:CheY-like chemotaxis protein